MTNTFATLADTYAGHYDQDAADYLDALAIEHVDVKAMVITPGGRIGNDTPFSRSRTSNWVARTGGLPDYVREVAHGLMKHGDVDESRAIHMAVGILENWASGRGNVSAKVRAAAAKAVAEFRAKATLSRAKTAGKRARSKKVWDHPASEPALQTKGDRTMEPGTKLNPDTGHIEYKAIAVKGLTVDDEDQGIVTAIVSVTGLVDNVNDNILPGAYEKSLIQRTPKGVWGHDWMTPVSKTLDAQELMPGDRRLPKTLPDGSPWPSNAGALQIKMQFNLDTDTGSRAFKNVKFFGPDQEWSIGYQVPVGGADIDTKTGVRNIRVLNCYEYSPVLFGAMPMARSLDVKSAQEAWRRIKEVVPNMGTENDDTEFKAGSKISDTPWSNFDASDYTDQQYAKACLVVNGDTKGDCTLPVREPDGTLNRNGVHAAAAALAGARGGTNLSPEDKKSAAKKLVTLYHQMSETPPPSIESLASGKSLYGTYEFKDVDVQPVDYDPDDDGDDDSADTMVQIGADDLEVLAALGAEISALVDRVTGAAGFQDDGGTAYETSPDAIDEDDLATKSEPYSWFESKDDHGETAGEGTFTDIVNDLADYRDDIANYDDLSDMADEYDQQIAAGDIDDALSTAQNFVDALESAMEDASEQETQEAIGTATQEIAAALQSEIPDDGSDDDGSDDNGTSDNDGDEPSGEGETEHEGEHEMALASKSDGTLVVDTKALAALQMLTK